MGWRRYYYPHYYDNSLITINIYEHAQKPCNQPAALQLVFLPTWSLLFSHSIVSDSVTPWTVACQAPLSIGFSRREYTGVDCHFLLQRIFPIQVSNLHWQVDSLTTEPPGKPNVKLLLFKNCSQKSTQGQL